MRSLDEINRFMTIQITYVLLWIYRVLFFCKMDAPYRHINAIIQVLGTLQTCKEIEEVT